jgi:hypothetical protein
MPKIMIPLFRDIEIVGNYFRDDAAKECFNALEYGVKLEIELEPENEHDKFAVRVLAGGVHLGYIPAHSSAICYALSDLETLSVTVTKVEAKKGGGQKVFLTMSKDNS